jgi:integrase/recombinase XerD
MVRFPGEKTMTAPRQPKQVDAGPLLPEIGSFRLHLAAEGKSAKTIRTYTEAARDRSRFSSAVR